MTPSSRPPRTPSRLSDSIHRQLNLYALAASAAGVSLLTSAPPAEAKVVYTKTHQGIGANGIYELDLNHDGIVDFLIQQLQQPILGSYSNRLLAKEALGNAVRGTLGNNSRFRIPHYASALKPGARIGGNGHFISGGSNGESMLWIWENQDSQKPYTYGQWIRVNNRYLGLKFKIRGKTHYGWARLSAHNVGLNISATLTGYAYETVPNRSIRAGQTTSSGSLSDTAKPEATASTTLGALALGARSVPPRRRR